MEQVITETPVVEKPVVETPKADAPAVETPKAEGETLLGNTEQEIGAEDKTAQLEATKAEEKRLLEADEKTLKPEELEKKKSLIKAQEDAKANVVPEKYDIKIEGMNIDTEALGKLTPIFKELKLTNAQVQKLAENYAPIIKAQVENQQKEAIAQWEKQAEDWKTESIKMLGPRVKEEMVFAAKFMNRFGGKEIIGSDGKKSNELRVLMEETKVGNHPVMLAAIIAAGKLLGEDKFVEGKKSGSGQEPSIYDHPTSKATLQYK